MITDLKPWQIFVFGSNLAGNHSGGAAYQAWLYFGAEDGIGEGLTGQCYAFPTLTADFEDVTVRQFVKSIEKLYATCNALPEKEFLLTAVGCGIAGYDESFVRSLFINKCGQLPPNLVLPDGWEKKYA